MNAVTVPPTPPAQMVELAHGTEGPPLFLIHAADGGAAIYEPMAAVFRGQHSVYVIEDALLDADSPTQQSRVEILAPDYLAKIKTIQPEGPYILGGYSFGGLVAFAIALLLAEQEEQVAHLFLMETPEPGVFPHRLPLRQRITTFVDSKRQQGMSKWRTMLLLTHRTLTGVATRLVHEVVTRTANNVPAKARSFLRSIWVRERNDQACADYLPEKPFTGRCDMWVCEDQGDKFESVNSPGWGGLLPNLNGYHQVPGNHLQFMQPCCMQAVAEAICGIMKT